MDDHSSAASVAKCSQAANPGLWAEASLWRSLLSPPACTFGRRRPFHTRPLFGIAPGGACRAGSVASPAVGFYPTVSPVPCQARGEPLKQQGSLFSVALSLGLPPPGVTRHPCFMESGLSSKASQPPRSSSHPRDVGLTPTRAGRQRQSVRQGQPQWRHRLA